MCNVYALEHRDAIAKNLFAVHNAKMNVDFDLAEDGGLRPTGAQGRSGSARVIVTAEDRGDYERARARKESALADKYELEVKIQSGEYVARSAVKQASATVLATIAQTLRSISDNLERRGVPADVCVLVDATVSEVLSDASKDLEILSDE